MISLTLKPEREKSLLRRHPWIFESAIASIKGSAKAGETVDVFSSAGKWLARGAISPKSQIRVRVWTFDQDRNVDAGFFADRIRTAVESRDLADGSAGRLVYSESDGLPGLIVDRYAGYLVCQFLTVGAERWRLEIVEALAAAVPGAAIFERSDVDVRDREGLAHRKGVLSGAEPPEIVEIQENDARFLVDLQNGHKTGFYLDQRENRAVVRRHAAGKEVLNCFAYTGGFGVSAAVGGARHVTNVDASTSALELARRNFELNGHGGDRASFVQADAFKLLRQYRDEGRQFDLVVLDPPKFADNKAQLMRASRGYKDINLLAFRLLRPGGLLVTFSCSGLMETSLFQKIVADAALDAGCQAQIIQHLFQAGDHPTLLSFPEATYLKGLVCRRINQ